MITAFAFPPRYQKVLKAKLEAFRAAEADFWTAVNLGIEASLDEGDQIPENATFDLETFSFLLPDNEGKKP